MHSPHNPEVNRVQEFPHRIAVIGATVAGVVALAGCASSGGGGGTPAGGNNTTPASSPTGKSPAAAPNTGAAALVPPSIAAKGPLTIAMDATYAPDEMIATDGHTIIGFDADLGKALADALGMKANLQNVTFDKGFAREVGDQLVFMDGGVIVESGHPREVLANPRHERTKAFLSAVL